MLGLQQWALSMHHNPSSQPPDIDFLFHDAVNIVQRLQSNGTDAVTWGDMKPFILRLIPMIGVTMSSLV